MTSRLLFGWLLALVASTGLAQQSMGPERSSIFPVQGELGIEGFLFVGDYGGDTSIAVLSLTGTEEGESHPSHLHDGDCGSGGGVAIPLADVDGASGLGVTHIQLAYDELLNRDYHVNAHRSAADMGTIVACGEVGAAEPQLARVQTAGEPGDGADAEDGNGAATADPTDTDVDADADEATTVDADTDTADDATAADETVQQGSLRTASYQLFPIDGGGLSATLNVSERIDGSTQFVVTVAGAPAGDRFLPVLFEGDCGPDRERVTALPPVGSIANDPYTSISTVEMSFDDVATGDLFLYLYSGDTEENPVACGEVGAGANR